MASSLQSVVSQNRKTLQKGSDGTLSETDASPPSISQLAGQAGLPAPPTDAASAAALGANPHQVKMQGSPAQVQSAIQQASAPQDQLATQVRQTQARSQTTDQEAQGKQKSADMQDLGGLGDRVSKFIDTQRQKLAATQVKATDVQGAAPTGYTLPADPNAIAAIKDAAKALLANPQDMNSLLTLNKSLGKSTDQTITSEELQQLYEDSTSTLSRSGAQAVQDKLQVEDLVGQQGFGYDLPTLSHLLNVPQDQLAKFSVTQLRQAIDAEQKQEFSKSSQLGQQAQSNVLGSAEKAQAASLGRETSATGVRASEADFAHMDQQIQNADQVQFGGQTYQVDQLLKDDTISGIIKQYLDNPNSAASKQLAQSEPGLLQFITKNQAVLKDASDALGAGAQAFQGIQTSNTALNKVGDQTLDTGLLKAVLPGYGELSATKLDPTKSAFFQGMDGLSDPAKKNYAQEANNLAAGHPDIASQFAKLTPEQLQKLQLDKLDSSPAIQAFQTNEKTRAALTNTSPDNADQVISMATGGKIASQADLNAILKQNLAAKTLGLGDVSNADLEGSPGSAVDSQSLYKRITAATPEATLADAADGKTKTFSPLSVNKYDPGGDPLATTLMQKLGPAAADGVLTKAEIMDAKLSPDDIFSVYDSGAYKKWGDAGHSIGDAVQDIQTHGANSLLSQYPVSGPDVTTFLNSSAPLQSVGGKNYYTADHVNQAKALEADITSKISGIQDRLKELQANPAAAERVDMGALQSAIAGYKQLLPSIQSQEEAGMDPEMMKQELGPSGIIDAAPATTSTMNKVIHETQPTTAIGESIPRAGDINPVQSIMKPVNTAKRLYRAFGGK
jgi:hypothetical protein